ncbi:CHASE4 domain-containing protein [Neiella marina]|nr:CHASE4 domain-containing protein [Neiella marina]
MMSQSMESKIGWHLLSFAAVTIAIAVTVISVTIWFDNREREELFAHQFSDILKNLVDNNFFQLQLLTNDFAYWDDMYQFVEQQNAKFIASNFSDASLESSLIHGVIIQSDSGSILFFKALLNEHSPVQTLNLFRSTPPSETDFGLLISGGQIFIYTSQLISNSNRTQETNGKLVLLRRAVPELSQQIAKSLGVEVRVQLTVPSFVTARYSFSDGYYIALQQITSMEGVSEAVIVSYMNNGTMIPAKVTLLLPKYSAAIWEPILLIAVIIIGVLAMSLLTWLLMRKQIIKPLKLLLHYLTTSASQTQAPKALGQLQELGQVLAEFKAIQTSLQRQNQHHQELLNSITDIVVTVNQHGHIQFANKQAVEWLAIDLQQLSAVSLDYLIECTDPNQKPVAAWLHTLLRQRQQISTKTHIRLYARPQQHYLVAVTGYPPNQGTDEDSDRDEQLAAVIIISLLD